MTTTGPNSAGTGASDSGNGGTIAWSNPGNITASDNTRAQAGMTLAATSQWLKGTNFGFAIPTGDTIDGILVEIERRSSVSASISDVDVKIVKGGTVSGNQKAAAGTWPTSDTYLSYGGAADLWGVAWTDTDINASTFGVVISVLGVAAATASVDHIRITITHTAAAGGQPMQTRATLVPGMRQWQPARIG